MFSWQPVEETPILKMPTTAGEQRKLAFVRGRRRQLPASNSCEICFSRTIKVNNVGGGEVLKTSGSAFAGHQHAAPDSN